MEPAKVGLSPLLDCHIGVRHGFGIGGEPVLHGRTQLLTQIHSGKVLVVKSADQLDPRNRADAMVTDVHGVALGIKTADCLPILVYDPVAGCIAAIHAGWRGLAKDIIAQTFLALKEHYGSHAEDALVAIGPAAGSCCYEVGPEFTDIFKGRGLSQKKGRWYFDLKQAASSFCASIGVENKNIWLSPDCTICAPAGYQSFRRDGDKAQRQISYITLV